MYGAIDTDFGRDGPVENQRDGHLVAFDRAVDRWGEYPRSPEGSELADRDDCEARARRDDRPSGGAGVADAPEWRRDDDPVGSKAADVPTVAVDCELRDTGRLARHERHLREGASDRLAADPRVEDWVRVTDQRTGERRNHAVAGDRQRRLLVGNGNHRRGWRVVGQCEERLFAGDDDRVGVTLHDGRASLNDSLPEGARARPVNRDPRRCVGVHGTASAGQVKSRPPVVGQSGEPLPRVRQVFHPRYRVVGMEGVRVAGVGLTHFGQTPDRTGRELFAEAAEAALADAGVDREAVAELHYGNFMGALGERQGHQAPLMAEAAGLSCPATRYELACASAGAAVRGAVRAVAAGQADVVVTGGMERMTNRTIEETTEALAIAADELFEVRAGVTFPGAYALMARSYFEEFGGEREDLAHVAMKNHENAVPNEYAQYRKAITVEQALSAPMIADPLGLYDSCPVTDGASALVVVSEAYAEANELDASVAIVGSGQGGDALALQSRADPARTPATDAAAVEAFADAGVDRGDVAAIEVHDCFTIAEVCALEGLGFYDYGEAVGAARRGETTADGDLPVNLSGGLKAKGHPVGATGGSQVVEMTRLLRGDHPNADAVDGTVGLTHNAGGTVASAVVHLLEVVE